MYAVPLMLIAALQTPVAPAKVVVVPSEIVLTVESSRQLRAEAYDSAGGWLQDAEFRWNSTDRGVVTVDPQGVLTAVRPGSARVVAVSQGVVGLVVVEVPQLPPASIRMALPVSAIHEGTSAPIAAQVSTRLGDVLDDGEIAFTSSDPGVARVDQTGRVYGKRPGRVTIRAEAGSAAATLDVRVSSGARTAYAVTPDAASVRTGDVIRFEVSGETAEGGEIRDLHPEWVVSGKGAQIEAEHGVGVFVAEEPGLYRVTALIGEELMRNATVKVERRRVPASLELVGRGAIDTHHSGDTWVFEGVNGRDYAYIGTFMHDWLKVWDVTAPAAPVLTDSVQLDARRINDVKIHPNNRVAVVTREGASSRRNGIVLLDLSDPAHPTILSEYTETVTGGVHNVWISGEHDLVYACHNGTSDLHIIDIGDPRNPTEAGRWGLDKQGKTLHDVIVQDGYAYLSYWDDGVIALDVGAGTHGGTPTEPAFVSQFKYPIGNTHTAWRHGRYLFVGDEIYPEGWNADRPIEARGYVHVIDFADPDAPTEVAWYEVPEAGAHNVWVEGDRLYVGYYQAGLRVVDISGELRGDLYRQGREIASLKTTDARTTVPNWPMTWGAQLFKGNLFTSDLNSGLWILRLVEERPVP